MYDGRFNILLFTSYICIYCLLHVDFSLTKIDQYIS